MEKKSKEQLRVEEYFEENNKLIATGKEYVFELEESWKQRLLKGLDSIGLTLQHEDEIRKYEENHK